MRKLLPLEDLTEEPDKEGRIKSGSGKFFGIQVKHILNTTRVNYLDSSSSRLTYNTRKDLHI